MTDKLTLTTNASHMRALTGREGAIIMDEITTPPTLVGSVGRAWLFDIEEQTSRLKLPPHSSIAQWLIEAPWAHPIWHSYVLSLIHLRPLGERSDASLITYLKGATHELVLYALDPELKREGALNDCRLVARACLSPKNYADQLIAPDDAAAAERIRAAVQDIIDGRLSPDTDHQAAWIARFGGHMMKKEYRR